jgi:hypothetical protein
MPHKKPSTAFVTIVTGAFGAVTIGSYYWEKAHYFDTPQDEPEVVV